MRHHAEIPTTLKSSKDGLDLGIKRNMGRGDSIDEKFPAAGFGKMEEAADVVVLIVGRKKPLDFGVVERERGERDGPAEFTGLGTIVANQFAQRHDGSASRSFSAHEILLDKLAAGRPRTKFQQLARIVAA
ncbi:MAG TPA: hypothetical protein VJN89_01095 [Candidatus Acidoferrum sp.]|nr:hypothetical protein [Candidatus Acidoferrum sp.]